MKNDQILICIKILIKTKLNSIFTKKIQILLIGHKFRNRFKIFFSHIFKIQLRF